MKTWWNVDEQELNNYEEQKALPLWLMRTDMKPQAGRVDADIWRQKMPKVKITQESCCWSHTGRKLEWHITKENLGEIINTSRRNY